MSSAGLKFRPADPNPSESDLESSVFASALEAALGPVAITENGKVLYANEHCRRLSNSGDAPTLSELSADSGWQVSNFVSDGHTLSVHTLRNDPALADSQYLVLLGRLVGGVAHDFNNLLTGILLYCDLLCTKVPPSNQIGQKIAEIRSAAEKGAGLIRQLMHVGREERDSARSVAFENPVREVLPLLRHLAGENIHLQTTFESGSGVVGLSLAQAQQIILNLVLNARDAMPDGGEVKLYTRFCDFGSARLGERRTFEFSVSDSGRGMDALTASRIFEPFFTTKGKGRGTGVGLATVRRIVEQASGTIVVDSTPGSGTRVTVCLPELQSDAGKLPPE